MKLAHCSLPLPKERGRTLAEFCPVRIIVAANGHLLAWTAASIRKKTLRKISSCIVSTSVLKILSSRYRHFSISVLAMPTHRAMTIHKDQTLPSGFTASGKPTADTMLNLWVALTAVNMTGLETALYSRSNPYSDLWVNVAESDHRC